MIKKMEFVLYYSIQKYHQDSAFSWYQMFCFFRICSYFFEFLGDFTYSFQGNIKPFARGLKSTAFFMRN